MLRLGRARNAEARRAHSQRVAGLVRDQLRLGEDDAVTVSEIACGEAQCGGAETVVLVMRPGAPTAARKLQKPMSAVDGADIAAAWGDAVPGGAPAQKSLAMPRTSQSP